MKYSLSFLALAISIQTIAAHQHHQEHQHSRQDTAEKRGVVQLDIKSPGAAPKLPGPSIQGLIPTFFDDFSGSAGNLPSSHNWIIDVGTQYSGGAAAWGNNEAQSYTESTDNIQITSDNTLEIIPRRSGPNYWTSGRIETRRSDFAALEGGKLYVEARIKLGAADASQQAGIWPAFWALGESFRGNYTNWPYASEWDFMEVVNGVETMYSTLHCDTAPGGACNEYNGLGSGGVPFSKGGWHRIGFLVDRSMCGYGRDATWEKETITWSLDGTDIFTISGGTIGKEDVWDQIAHEGHFLLLNVAVGGNWPGQPTASTIDGKTVGMEVDYVGVWNSLVLG